MILVDTSVWVEHLRAGSPTLAELLETEQVLAHPFVIGELALGSLRRRTVVIDALKNLPQATVASDEETLGLIERRSLFGLGIGYVDAHLLAATLLSSGASLWTRDRKLGEAAVRLGVAARAH